MLFGNLSNGIQFFTEWSGNDGQGNWTPAKEYALVGSKRADSKTNTWQYALYKVSFQNPNTGEFEDPEWRLYGEGMTELIGDDISYTYFSDSPKVTIEDGEDNTLTDTIPYIATYTTAEEGNQALESSVPKFGCRDPPATNYDHSATMDDGTCEYGEEKPNHLLWGVIAVAGILGISQM